MILNEKKYAEILYRSGKLKKQKEFLDFLVLGKYFNYISKIEDEKERFLDIRNNLEQFSNKYWTYEIKKNKNKVIGTIMGLLVKYDLYMADEIFITKDEIQYIKFLQNKDLQNVFFSILILCKVQKNNNIRQVEKFETKLAELLLIQKQTKKIENDIAKIKKNIENRNNDSLIVMDKSKHQINIFSHCNFDKNITINQKQQLLLELINLKYININTIRNNCKLISINEFENNLNDIAFKINCNPINSNEYDFFNFQYLWDELVLNKKIDLCENCFCKINKNIHNQKYCNFCALEIQKGQKRIWKIDYDKSRKANTLK